jgi:tRNA-Thr(GGU) m(6)t(6)A37 methyltransferase TsaA
MPEFKPIGFVLSNIEEKTDVNWGSVFSRIILYAENAGGLLGLEGFSHALILTHLHHANYEKSKHLQRHPRDLDHLPKVGIFSQRSKDRPNPIGVTAVRILSVGHDYLDVQGLDAINGTPILDIKPYYPNFDRIDSPVIPEWVKELMKDYF